MSSHCGHCKGSRKSRGDKAFNSYERDFSELYILADCSFTSAKSFTGQRGSALARYISTVISLAG